MTHFKRNIQTKVKASDKDAVAEDLREVFLTVQRNYTRGQTLEKFNEFATRWGENYDAIKRLNGDEDMEYYFTYLDFDRRIQSMIYTTNWIERLNKKFRRSLKIRNALPSVESA